MTLFRPEVQQAQSAQWMGSVRLDRPMGFGVVTAVALLMAVALGAFAAWGEINRKARLSGILVPTQGSLNITAPQAGTIFQRRVQEGDLVAPGDVLLVINAERQSLVANAQGGASAVGDTSALVAQQIELRRQTLMSERAQRELQSRQRDQVLSDRLRTLEAELHAGEDQIAGQTRRIQLAQKTLERHQSLARDGFISDAQAQAKQEELIDANTQLQSLQRTQLSRQQDRQALLGERQALQSQLQTDLTQLARTLASVSQEAAENSARQTAVLIAPRQPTSLGTPAGRYRVTAMNLQPGQFVQAGQSIATLVPETSTPTIHSQPPHALEAQLFAPSHTAGFIQPGQTVFLRYAAYPFQKFGLHTGRITAISATPFSANELPPNMAQQLMAQAGSAEALYRINVALDAQTIHAYGQDQALKAGLTLEADVLQERRRIWEWVLEPVLAARAQMQVMAGRPAAAQPAQGM